MPHQIAWLIFLLPVFSFLIISFILRPFFNGKPRLSGYVTIAAIGLSFVFSLWALSSVWKSPDHRLDIPSVSWLVIKDGFTLNLGIIMDGLTAIMLVVVSLVSLMVQIYSQGYMKDDPGYHRYYAFMSLFTGSMLGLVLASNLVQLYVFWELVGLCSYLLIGFWFHRPAAANAAKKAFIVTRIGDFGFLIAILFLFFKTGTVDIEQLHSLAVTGALSGTVLTWAAIGIFSGAVGKSAQFPLHVWLPDAMEGPTPVSALIHAATMVAAGVFLVARTFPLFEHSEQALTTVAIIGGFTAIFAASIGLVMNDIKRVVAYSTISQLGYMMLGLGAGGIAVGIFHLFNHAFFKALLFLGAGSVHHTTGTFDMRQMGGLRKVMPWTFGTFLVASLSLAGIWPLAGFWSKDEVLAVSLEHRPVLFYLALITVFMTAFYIFRALFLTFGGQYRGKASDAPAGHGGHGGHGASLHESPVVMVAPMVLLAVLAVSSGWINLSGAFTRLLQEGESHSILEGLLRPLSQPLPWISMLMGGLGILLAYAIYSARWISAESIGKAFKPVYVVLSRKYWFDELYEQVIVSRVSIKWLFGALQWLDAHIVDGAVNLVGHTMVAASKGWRKAQTGQLQAYGLTISLGVVVIVAFFYIFG